MTTHSPALRSGSVSNESREYAHGETLQARRSTNGWLWLAPALLPIVVLVVLGGLISQLDLFQRSTVGTPRLTASQLVRFLAYSGALAIAWLTTRRAVDQLKKGWPRGACLGDIAMATVVLSIACCSYSVALIALKGLLGSTARTAFDWIFIVAISGCAAWLVFRLFKGSDAILALMSGEESRGDAAHD